MKHWHETREVLDFLARARDRGKRVALATVVRVRGSAYRHEGAKLAVAEDGSTAGNVSGGCLEQDVREVALQALRAGRSELRHYCSSADEIEAWDLGVGCEGQVDVFVEPAPEPRRRERELLDERRPFAVCTLMPGIREAGSAKRLIVTADAVEGDLGSTELGTRVAALARELGSAEQSGLREIAGRTVFVDVFEPPPQLVVLGAGDDARPLARFASDVGFRVVVVDRRPGYLTAERFPGARLVESPGDELAAALPLDPGCYAVVMTHIFADDQAYLRALLRTPVAYIGMLGPRERTERILKNLTVAVPLGQIRVYGPVGLDIGTDGAEQVALSVIAEMLAVRSGRRARSLRERAAPIHAPAD